jgi:alpha/beta superfamily hydrolase
LSGEGDRRLNVLLNTPLPAHRNLILVGSSMGAYVSTAASATLQPKGLFLLAPAFYLPGYAVSDIRAHAEKVEVVHGWSDDIVPVENSIRFARNHQAALHILNSNHRLDDAVAELQWLFDRFMRSVISSGRG